MKLSQQDNIFLLTSLFTAAVGGGLMVGGFILRFGRGFGTFVKYAEKDDDFLELGRLDIVFGMFTAAAGILVLSFFLALLATLRKNKFLLITYCALIALMIVVQLITGVLGFQYSDSVKVLADQETLQNSINAVITVMDNNNGNPGNDDQSQFWLHTQKIFNCCGDKSNADWGKYSTNATSMKNLNCFIKNYQIGCEKQIRSRIAQDTQYLAVASMGVLVVELVASFLAAYRAYNLKYDEEEEEY